MAVRNALVDGVKGFSAQPAKVSEEIGESPPARLTVNFSGGKAGFLDMSLTQSTVWAEVLESLSREGLPAYVELDPDTAEIKELLIPIEVFVRNLSRSDKDSDVEVELEISHARHILKKDNPEFDELLQTLEDAKNNDSMVIVSENDNHEIIDVRIASQSTEGGL